MLYITLAKQAAADGLSRDKQEALQAELADLQAKADSIVATLSEADTWRLQHATERLRLAQQSDPVRASSQMSYNHATLLHFNIIRSWLLLSSWLLKGSRLLKGNWLLKELWWFISWLPLRGLVAFQRLAAFQQLPSKAEQQDTYSPAAAGAQFS